MLVIVRSESTPEYGSVCGPRIDTFRCFNLSSERGLTSHPRLSRMACNDEYLVALNEPGEFTISAIVNGKLIRPGVDSRRP
jgi:hypothetical protein